MTKYIDATPEEVKQFEDQIYEEYLSLPDYFLGEEKALSKEELFKRNSNGLYETESLRILWTGWSMARGIR